MVPCRLSDVLRLRRFQLLFRSAEPGATEGEDLEEW